MKKGYPFLPLVDSMFGECLQKVWVQSNLPQDRLVSLISSLSTDPEGFTFTANATKEMLLSQAPSELRVLIQEKNVQAIVDLLLDLTQGRYENQSTGGIDIALELMEWLLTGFESELDFTAILQAFFSHAPEINPEFVSNLRKEYDIALRS
ncbi:MAG: hypothetical protein MH321_10475 [Leptospiraceae bacterium]|nr:hypothetical protein [Leptospiraceae bacterium]